MRTFRRSITWFLGPVSLTCLTMLGAGCTLNAAKVSSGEVGCPADEITISEDAKTTRGRTWIASCRGEIFYCSATRSGEGVAQYNCTPALRSTHASQPAPAPAARSAPADAEKPFPTSVLGFEFASAPDTAQAACSSQGHEWQGGESSYSCSGAGVEMGMPLKTELTYCTGSLCEIRAFTMLAAGADGTSQLAKLRRALVAQYGEPDLEDNRLPKACKETLMACIASKEASWSCSWEWADGSIIRARAASDGKAAVVGLLYRNGPNLDEAADGLNAEAL